MRSLIGLFSNGGAVANIWHRVPFGVKAPVVVGLVLLAGAELTRDLNISFRSGRVAEGQAVDADAKIADPNATRAAVLAGKPVTGAERTIAAQVAGLDADADQKRATADAANESEEELIAKARRGAKLTSTEKLRWRELQLKEKELAIREQELAIKTAEASSADSKAAVQNWINDIILGRDGISGVTRRRFDDGVAELAGQPRTRARRDPQALRRPKDTISEFTDSQYEKSWERAFGTSPQRQQSAGGTLVDRVMENEAFTPSIFKRRDPGETVRKLEGRISDPFQ